jgi:hypothetical protein
MKARFIKLFARSLSAASVRSARSRQESHSNPHRTARWRAGTCLLVLLACLNRSQADTQVCGTIVDGHWTLAGSPYRVTCDTYVVSLNIDPGVWLLFQSNYVFEVDGVLTAVGTAAQPICFTQTNGASGWRGINLNYSSPGSQLVHCTVSNSAAWGIRIVGIGVPAIQNCIIANNAYGGILAFNVSGVDLVLESCTVVNNGTSSSGGNVHGVYADIVGGDVVLRYCTVAKNSSWWHGGGGINASTTPANGIYLEGCTIAGNRSDTTGGGGGSGGGISVSGNLLLRNCLVTTNTCDSSSGAGIAASGGTFAAYNCVFSGNIASGGSSYGGAISLSSSATPAIISNCSFAHNAPGGVAASGSGLSVVNSIFWAMSGGGGQISGTTNVSFCDVQDGFPGLGNTNLNPIFTDQTTLTLVPGSPCIDAGNPDPTNNDTCFPPSQGGVRNDMGAYGGPGACGWLLGKSPTITAPPQTQVSCLGQSAAFQVTAAGTQPLSYQWWYTGGPLGGQTSTNLLLTGLHITDATSYWVVVSNAFGSVTSAPVQLVVNEACVDLRMYAGLNITGQSGASYVLSYTTDLTTPVNWIPLATNTMPIAGWFYLDMTSPFSPHRFYNVTLKP